MLDASTIVKAARSCSEVALIWIEASTLSVVDGVIHSRKGHKASYGSLTEAASASRPLSFTSPTMPTIVRHG